MTSFPKEDVRHTKVSGIQSMFWTRWILLFLLGLSTSACSSKSRAPTDGQEPRSFAFVAVNVVPMDHERILENQTVITQGERIVAIGPSDILQVPPQAESIDGRGKYLIPGFADMHVHLQEEEELVLCIANGVTTIRQMWGEDPWHLDWRKKIAEGELLGPRIYTAGPVIDGSPPKSSRYVIVDNPEEAESVVARHKELEFDFIKILSHLSPQAYEAILSAAKAHDIPVIGHVPYQVDLERALTSGLYSIEHLEGYNFALMANDAPAIDLDDRAAWLKPWEYFDESKLPALAKATAEMGVWNCPTLVVFINGRILPEELDDLLNQPNIRYVVPYVVDYWKERKYNAEEARIARGTDQFRKKTVKALHDAGARLLLGTDTHQFFVLPGFSIHEELEHFLDAGLSAFEAIKAGTANAAEFLGAADEFGTVTVGRIADLILLHGNPLEDITNTTRRAGVMVRGTWFSDRDLDKMLEKIAESFER